MKLRFNRAQKKKLYRIILSLLLLIPALLVKTEGIYSLLIFLPAYLAVGYDTLIKAFKGICSLQPFDEDRKSVV